MNMANYNVVEAGADPSGHSDCTTVFQQLLDRAGADGVVYVPAGHYRFDGNLRIPGSVTLQGTYAIPPTDQRRQEPVLAGSVLRVYTGRGSREAEPFIRLADSMAAVTHYSGLYLRRT